MAKKFLKIHYILLGKSNINNFEKTFVIYTTLVFAIFSVIAYFINTSISIAPELRYVVGLTFIFCISLFLICRFTDNILFAKTAITIGSILLTNFFWIYNYNSRGPVLYCFVVVFSLMLFIWDMKRFIYLFLLILFNIIILFFIEYYYPDKLQTYPSEKARIWDIYTGLIIYLSVIYAYTVAAKNNYINQYKKAKESEHLKTAFLHNLSHEIRTPLNAIVGFSSLLVDSSDTDDKEKFKQVITENSDHLIRLIEDMIDMSMIETNQLSIKKSNFNLYNSLKNLHEIFKFQVKDNVSLEVELGNKDFTLNSDKTRLEQILMNLLKNAIKFTPEGIIRFGYKIENKQICFFVKDTGIGIEEGLEEKIFDRFTKGHESSKILYRGAGIGLFLTKRMVEMLGGKIWVESEINKGSTFFFTMPLTSSITKN